MSNETTKINLYPMYVDSDYETVMGLVYGSAGAGKSYLSCTMVGTINKVITQEINGMKVISKILCADLEQGFVSCPKSVRPTIINDRFKVGQTVKTIIAKPIKKYIDFLDMYDFLRKHHILREKGDIKALKGLQDKYFAVKVDEIWLFDGFICDSLTVLQRLCIYYLKKIDLDTIDLRVAIPKADFSLWGQALDGLTILMQSFRTLSMHQIFTCQMEVGEDENKSQLYRPSLQGSIKQSIASPFDFVGKLDVDVSKDGVVTREMSLLPTRNKHIAKHRFSMFKGSKLPCREIKKQDGSIVQPNLSLTFDTCVKLKNEDF